MVATAGEEGGKGGWEGGLKAAIQYQFSILSCKRIYFSHEKAGKSTFLREISCILKFRYNGHPDKVKLLNENLSYARLFKCSSFQVFVN